MHSLFGFSRSDLRDSSIIWTPRYSLISICWPFIVMALGLFLLLLQSTTWVLRVLSIVFYFYIVSIVLYNALLILSPQGFQPNMSLTV